VTAARDSTEKSGGPLGAQLKNPIISCHHHMLAPMDPMFETPAIVEFGRFRILPHRRELLADGQPIRIGGRAFDVLSGSAGSHLPLWRAGGFEVD
jgi:hypothetical protein